MPRIAKVSRDQLAQFLRKHAKTWNAGGPPLHAIEGSPLSVSHRYPPFSVVELIENLTALSADVDYVFVVDEHELGGDIVEFSERETAPFVAAEELDSFTFPNKDGEVSLSIAPNDDYASNGDYLTINALPERRFGERGGLTGIAIKNFKGIGDWIEIELKPITLLFGANSAGKSSVLHALHYAREIFERHNVNPDRTLTGGRMVDLGGYRTFLHNDDIEDSIGLRFDLDLRHQKLPDYLPDRDDLVAADIPIPELGDFVENAAVEISIWSDEGKEDEVYVCTYDVSINGERIATLFQGFKDATVELEIAAQHPIFRSALTTEPGRLPNNWSWLDYWSEASWSPYRQNPISNDLAPRHNPTLVLETDGDCLPRWGELLAATLPDLDMQYVEQLFSDEDVSPPMQRELFFGDDDEAILLERVLRAFLTQLIVGPGEILRNELSEFRYLGPIRETPPRNHVASRYVDPYRWADGLAAWDELLADDRLTEEVSEWLSNEDRLNAGHSIRVQRFRLLPEGSPLMVLLRSGRAFDEIDDLSEELDRLAVQSRVVLAENGKEILAHDVGVGVSQIVPVIVMSLDKLDGLVIIEQPELHVHPRLQAEIGDLFIESAMMRNRKFLIETHSEHLILRLLRRIRENARNSGRSVPFDAVDLSVYCLRQEDGQTRANRIDVDRNGEFVQPWPDDFFEIDFQERFS